MINYNANTIYPWCYNKVEAKCETTNEKKKKSRFGGGFVVYGEYGINEVQIVRVMYKNPVTVVFWSDNTRTVAKCREGDTYNSETGLQVAILKKVAGNSGFRNAMNDWLPEQINLLGEANVNLSDVRKKHK